MYESTRGHHLNFVVQWDRLQKFNRFWHSGLISSFRPLHGSLWKGVRRTPSVNLQRLGRITSLSLRSDPSIRSVSCYRGVGLRIGTEVILVLRRLIILLDRSNSSRFSVWNTKRQHDNECLDYSFVTLFCLFNSYRCLLVWYYSLILLLVKPTTV